MHPDAPEGRGEIGGEAGELSGRLVLVLGCHRSGTSVVAQSLTCLGAELGPKSQWSGADNPSGFAEDLDVLAIDEILLTMLGIPWFNAEPIDWPPQSRDMTRLGAFVTKLVRERLRQFPLWAVKEPRLCRLLPFWRSVFAAVGCSVSVVHVVRHPLAVAQSMLHRNGIPIESGLAVWLAYTRAARADADPAWPAATVCYEDLMTDPATQIARIGATLGLPIDVGATQLFARDSVRLDLWHQEGDGPLPPGVAAEWAAAREGCR